MLFEPRKAIPWVQKGFRDGFPCASPADWTGPGQGRSRERTAGLERRWPGGDSLLSQIALKQAMGSKPHRSSAGCRWNGEAGVHVPEAGKRTRQLKDQEVREEGQR